MTSAEPTAVRSTAVVRSIAIAVQPFEWTFPRDEAARIETHWARQCAQKPGLFDGRVLLARDLEVRGDTLTGAAFETGYKSFLSWRDFGFPGKRVVNLFAMPALRSSDGAFMLGRMSQGTANAGKLYFPAGTPEPSDAGPDGSFEADANILRELEEETGLTSADVTLDSTWTILFAGPMVACMKVARSTLPAGDLQRRVAAFIATQRAPELDGLHAVRSGDALDDARMPPFMQYYLKGALATA